MNFHDSHPEISLSQEMEARRPVSAWMMSLCVHAALFVLLGISWTMAPRGATVESDRSVGIVLVHEQAGKREYLESPVDGSDDAAAAAAISAALPHAAETPVDLSSELPGAEVLVGGTDAEAILDATHLTGDGTPRRGGLDRGGTSTEVFGIQGTGSKFVYVFDRSGSMDGHAGRPLRAAKLELTQSLDDLVATNQFQIIFYNERPKIFQPNPGKAELVWGDDTGKRAGKTFVDSIIASGGTHHLDAIQLALNMNPDVVFFLTDADEPRLSAAELTRIRSWNHGAMIHAIEFGFGPPTSGDNFLKRLARQNGGQHAYVDLSLLRDRL